VEGIKKIFWIGVGRKKPARVEEVEPNTAAPAAAPAADADNDADATAPSEGAPTAIPPVPVVLVAPAEETPATTALVPAAPTEQPPTVTPTVPAEDAVAPVMVAPIAILPMVQATA